MWQAIQRHGFLDVNHFSVATPYLHGFFRFFAMYGVVVFAVLLLVNWWWARMEGSPRAMAAAIWAPLGVLLAVLLNQPLGHQVHEARPYAVLPHVTVLVARTQDFSFPSDHAVMAGAAAAGILLLHRGLGLVATAAAVLMAFSRVYVGAHFPLDVVAGLLFGALVAVLGYLLVRPVIVGAVERLANTPLRPLLTAAPSTVAR